MFRQLTLKCLASLFSLMLLANCSSPRPVFIVEPPCPMPLVSINIQDRNGFCETISNTDKLKSYSNVDFLKPQPYQKVLRVYDRDYEGNIRAYVTTYHENGQPKQYLEVLNNSAFGKFKEWHANGKQKIEVTVIGGNADLNNQAELSWLFDHMAHVWDENGCLIATIPYEKGELEGESLYYYPNGVIWKRVNLCKGLLEGLYQIYTECGDLKETIMYSKGYKHGPSKLYRIPSVLVADELFDQGRLMTGYYIDPLGRQVGGIVSGTGYKVVFNADQTFELQEYKGGLQEGKVQIFTRNGLLKQVFYVKNGNKNGEEIEYYPLKDERGELIPKLSINWYEGQIQGIVKTWYNNGVQQSHRELSKNRKNGLATAWYSNGSLMMIEEYENDRLQKGDYFKLGDHHAISQVMDGKGVATLFDDQGNFLQKVSYLHGLPED